MTIQFTRRTALATAAGVAALPFLAGLARAAPARRFEITLSKAQWQAKLSPAAFYVLREEGTERPYSSPLNDEKRAGIFKCAGCALPLFSSRAKYDSRTGWPSFTAPLANAVGTSSDRSLLFERTEIHCRRCGGHLGHVFDDGPPPTGKRYCMNGVAMTFAPAKA